MYTVNYSNGWALYLYNGQLRHGSSSGGNEFSSKYAVGSTIRVELDLDSRPRTLSFTLSTDKAGTGPAKKAFDLPEGEYWPSIALQHSVRGGASLSLNMISTSSAVAEAKVNSVVRGFKWDPSWNASVPNLQIDSSGLHLTDASKMYTVRADQSYRAGKHVWSIAYGKGDYVKLGIVNASESKTSQMASGRYFIYLFFVSIE